MSSRHNWYIRPTNRNFLYGGKIVMFPNRITGQKEFFYQKLDPIKGPTMVQISPPNYCKR